MYMLYNAKSQEYQVYLCILYYAKSQEYKVYLCMYMLYNANVKYSTVQYKVTQIKG